MLCLMHPNGFIDPCLPTISCMVPTGRPWAYEIKHDGFRFLAVRQRERVRVHSRGGHDWSKQLPAIVAALQALTARSVVLDGEGAICGPDDKSDFDRMRACFSRQGTREAFLYAFDLLELDGRDLRNEPWARRRATLAQLLAEAGGRQAARQPLPLGTLPRLDQDQEPGASGNRARHADRLEQTAAAERMIEG
jgi:bifunctional non-homologous end joining protein LigD